MFLFFLLVPRFLARCEEGVLTVSIQNDHPHRCNACGAEYRAARYAARCCKVSCVDLRDGTVTEYSQEAEDAAIAADNARWEALYAEYRYECSCGESYWSIDAAIRCRKCRWWTEAGYCTEVTDRDQDHKVVWSLAGSADKR